VIILEQLPLTAVGKPQKNLLQQDAARRALEQSLQNIPGRWQLDVGTEGGGLLLTVKVAPGQQAVRDQVQQILAGYALRSRVIEA
jgi:hypothetical protein